MPDNDLQREALKARYTEPGIVASYLEAEWGDFLYDETKHSWGKLEPSCERTPFPVKLLEHLSVDTDFSGTLLDIGGATGRLIWEWANRFPKTKRLTLVEPSPDFASLARRFLFGEKGDENLPLVDEAKTPKFGKPFRLPSPIDRDKVEIINAPLEEATLDEGSFDVVFCCNVVDRHPEPSALLQKATSLVRPSGMVVFASPFDWEHAFTSPDRWFSDFSAVLGNELKIIHQTEIVYPFRYHTRHISIFLSQVVVALKQA